VLFMLLWLQYLHSVWSQTAQFPLNCQAGAREEAAELSFCVGGTVG